MIFNNVNLSLPQALEQVVSQVEKFKAELNNKSNVPIEVRVSNIYAKLLPQVDRLADCAHQMKKEMFANVTRSNLAEKNDVYSKITESEDKLKKLSKNLKPAEGFFDKWGKPSKDLKSAIKIISSVQTEIEVIKKGLKYKDLTTEIISSPPINRSETLNQDSDVVSEARQIVLVGDKEQTQSDILLKEIREKEFESKLNKSNPLTIINRLPSELRNQILSFLPRNDLSAVTEVDRNSRLITKKYLNLQMEKFIVFLKKNLKNESSLKSLLEIRSTFNSAIDEPIFSVNWFRETCLEKLKALSIEELCWLEEVLEKERDFVFFIFFKKTFCLAKIYKNLHAANSIPDSQSRSFVLRNICGAFLEVDNTDENNIARNLADSIPDSRCRDFALVDVCDVLLKTGKLDFINKAIDVANSIYVDYSKDMVLLNICNALLKIANPDTRRIVDIANSISTYNLKSMAFGNIVDKDISLKDLCNLLLKNNNANEIREKSTALRDRRNDLLREKKSTALRDKCSNLLKAHNPDIKRAREIADSIPDSYMRGFALRDICQVLLKIDNTDKNNIARDTVNLIYDPQCKSFALVDICNTLLEIGSVEIINKVIDIAHSIPQPDSKSIILLNICNALLEAGNIDINKVKKVANSIPVLKLRRLALENIMLRTLKQAVRFR